jgi:hypothetical protein
VLRPCQHEKLARGTKDEEHAMSQTPNTAMAVIGIDIGKNSLHVVGDSDIDDAMSGNRIRDAIKHAAQSATITQRG